MEKIIISDEHVKQYRVGYPQIMREAIDNIEVIPNLKEGDQIELVDRSGQFLGRGYYGNQNKCVGWVLTQNKKELINQEFIVGKISAALSRRSKLFSDQATTAFRIFNAEGDGFGGMTIDYYDQYLLINWYSQGVYSYKKEIIEALGRLMSFKGIYEKARFQRGKMKDGHDDFVTGERAKFPLIIKENGINYAVDLNDGPMTGIFLDQRHVRRAVRNRYANGKSVLNTFSYTGAFSVAAIMGGAKHTVSVDLANRSKPKTIEQFEINNINVGEHEIRVIDVFNYFDYAIKNEIKFDTVILDPPSFARSKKRTFSAEKDYTGLLEDAIKVTEDDGIIVASTNHNGFGINQFKKMIDRAFKMTKTEYEIVEIYRLPEDFPVFKEFKEGNYLKVVVLRKTA